MRLAEKAIIDDLLVSEETCLGAAFCTYTFDPAYFEEQVLRCLLRLRGDPNEDGPRYHEEAVRALQTTPVACIVDASVRQGGRRLPYDLHLVRGRTFHPKVYVVLYESEARVAVGSGNLTKSGIEENTEVFFVRSLRYDDPHGAAMLRDLESFLGRCALLSSGRGSQLDLVRSALSRRVEKAAGEEAVGRTDVSFVSSFGSRILDALGSALPTDAKLARVGVLAPFFEEDDLAAGDPETGLRGALADILALRPSEGATLDIGVPWEDAPVTAPAAAGRASLAKGVPGLWAWRRRAPGVEDAPERVTYLTIERVGDIRVEGVNASGEACRLDRDELEADVEDRSLWRVATPQVHAPEHILSRIAAERPTAVWLHPASELAADGHVRRRLLHAKVLLLTAIHRGVVRTYAYFGSANASRGALARSFEQHGNVEAGVILRFDGEVTLRDVMPTLVWHRIEGLNLVERPEVSRPLDFSAWIDEVVYDAGARSLRIRWRDDGPVPLGPWSIRYHLRAVATGDGPSPNEIVVADFHLDAASAEVLFCGSGAEWSIPIRVEDLAVLPVGAPSASIGLRELLALLGRRVSPERLAVIASRGAADGAPDALEAAFGAGFGPTDVFKAWWGGVEDLRDARSVPAFRLCLLGPRGLQAAWHLLRDGARDALSDDEVWVYGCELLRELRALTLPAGPDSEPKNALLRPVVEALAGDLERMAPAAAGRTWLHDVSRFYELGARP